MTDQKIKDHAYDCGFYGTTPPCLANLTAYERELWDAAFEEGRRDEQEEAASETAHYQQMCSIYGYD